MTDVRTRFLWPVVLISVGLVFLCAFTAISLFHQQATLARDLRENVASRRVATEMEECLLDLLALLNDHVESVAALHDRARMHLTEMRRFADQDKEIALSERLAHAFDHYLSVWKHLPAPQAPGHEAGVREAKRILELELVKPCQEFEQYNGARIEESTKHHDRVLRQLAWGMAGIGLLGGVAGLVLGFGAARGVTQSIRRLRVEIRDAAGKLDPTSPEVVLTEVGDFEDLHEEVSRLATQIEGVVQRLQRQEREILRAEQLAAVGQLAAGVGHEIRNPLTSIKLLVQAGQEDAGGLAAEDLRIIEGEIRRMELSLQTFLDFARPPKPDPRPADLREAVVSVIMLTRGRAEKQRVTVELEAPPGPITLTADIERLKQVLVNLILNALDAMPTGGTIFVTIRVYPDRILVDVADTGPGIPEELKPKLFEPFMSTKDTGVGLGLVISKQFVEDHGGHLIVADRPGGGALFRVSLPHSHPRLS
ncbi:MAG: hypothetical protein LC104_08690 [Bacteroidales bacterium]|nr:hypothetical protein [Bacteroidales bacterium]